ncbi:MAG: hypothetical protein LWX56_15185 [Ignavibacteria bacterium]|nr:hypothetical protein [Ignavibacteria bacterium]
MNHPDNNIIDNFIAGSLPNDENKNVQEHIEFCPECKTRVEVILRVEKHIDRELTHLVSYSPSEQLASRIMTLIMENNKIWEQCKKFYLSIMAIFFTITGLCIMLAIKNIQLPKIIIASRLNGLTNFYSKVNSILYGFKLPAFSLRNGTLTIYLGIIVTGIIIYYIYDTFSKQKRVS